MKRRNLPFIVFLLLLSALSGWLMSHMSWIGRVGIDLMHKEYKPLKVWYRGGGIVFAILLVLFLLQWLADRKLAKPKARGVQIVALLLAVAGLLFTYNDFRTDFTHNILKERFHLGMYLFWVGWMSISLYLLATFRVQHTDSQVQVERR